MLIAPLAKAADVRRSTAEIVRPPRRITPSEARNLYLRNEKGPWSPTLAPEMDEPLDLLASRQYQGIVMVGPARSSKTFGLILGAVAYVVTSSPGDMLIVQMSQDTARDFSRTDLDRAIRNSPELASRLSPRPRDDNTYDKFWRSGIVLKIGWPAVSQLSSKTLKYVLLTDYDRPENVHDVDGEGPMWDLGWKRVQTYMSRGKCLAESSPGEDYFDPQWKPSTPHEAPPARGIASLYNRGTRARLYWPCLHCGQYSQVTPGTDVFALPEFEQLEQMVVKEDPAALAERYARVVCHSCGGLHEQDQKPAMKARARWVHEGESIDRDGTISGQRRRTNIASFWLGGAAASYQTWDGILGKYFEAIASYVRTGDEAPIRTTVNTDQAAVYIPRVLAKRRGAKALMSRLEEWPRGMVPKGVRFLTAAVDVQMSRFVVKVYGWGPGLEAWVVDYFEVTGSARPEGDRLASVDPAAYLEDWDVLIPQVIERTYPLDGAPDRELGVHFALCDSGGRSGVTNNAYKWWRTLKGRGLGNRLQLVRGDGRITAPRMQVTWPDSRGRKDRHAESRGDVPVWALNTNLLKDGVVGDLAREAPGPGFVHLPKWLPPEYFDELTAESRNAKGVWEKPSGRRNEPFDLHVYNRAAVIALQAEVIDWERPPEWATDPWAAAPSRNKRPKTLAEIAAELNG